MTNPSADALAALDLGRLRAALVPADGGFWTRLDVVERTGSTNGDLLERALHERADRQVLLAEYQDSGRGRHARRWVSPPRKQLSISAVLEMPGGSLQELSRLPLIASLAVVDAIREQTGIEATLKWPNDVMAPTRDVDGVPTERKLAGILAEVIGSADVPSAVVGMGVNVALTEDELPVDTATSLLIEGAGEVDRTALAIAILTNLAGRWQRWADSGWQPGLYGDDYRAACGTLGREVSASLPNGESLIGRAIDVDDLGRLVLAPATGGEPVAIAAADVTHLRPTAN